MKQQSSIVFFLVASALLVTACNKSESAKPNIAEPSPTPAPIAEQLSDENGHCTETATVAFAEAAQKISAYDKDPSEANLNAAGSSCEKLQNLIGEKSCKMATAEPQIQLDKNVLGQSCSGISAKITLAREEAAKPEISLSQILDGEFLSSSDIKINSTVVDGNNLRIEFKSGAKTEAGTPFEAMITCGFSSNSSSTQTEYNGEKTIIKENGDIVRICKGTSEVKVGQKTKNAFHFKVGYCQGANDVVATSEVEVKLLADDKVNVSVQLTAFNKKTVCSGDLNKKAKK